MPWVMTKSEKRAEKASKKAFKLKYGKSPESYKKNLRNKANYREWAKIIHSRGNRCEYCGMWECDGAVLVAHHMDEFAKYPKKRYKVSNGYLICTICHAEIHHWLR